MKREDRVLLERLLADLESDYQITDKEVYLAATNKRYPVSQVKINSTQLCLDLMRLGITPRKSQREVMPHIPDELMPAGILGAFDGDGCLYIHPRKSGALSQVALSWVAGMGLLEGIKAWIERTFNVSLPPGAISRGVNGALRLCISDSVLIDRIGRVLYAQPVKYLERKRARFEELSEMLRNHQ